MTDGIAATAKEAAPNAGVILFSRPEYVAVQGQEPTCTGDQPAALQIPSGGIKVSSRRSAARTTGNEKIRCLVVRVSQAFW